LRRSEAGQSHGDDRHARIETGGGERGAETEQLGLDQSLPPVDPLDIILVRSKGATCAPCEALSQALLEEGMGP